ncbi:alpha-N-acetylglucosaminidase [Pedobacter sp. LMG 31464]|uniref:Alpha-N-acetylglucosaminidase n=1 Tax=Pedobacter planticolens TaxID=2679964 RepID=A0A923DVL9_9SPHI|nr:alpha-N-acetylglucosaminidase [Pedobacter planticolens]MBB2144771.1 alpha-N-acetylglucosaminidase [Pedobacter planticolens]
MKTVVFNFLFFLCFALNSNAQRTVANSPEVVKSLIKRIIPTHASSFEVKFIPQKDNKDAFSIETHQNKILLSGSNGVSIASALNYYLKNFTNCDISWNGSNLKLPKVLPFPKQKITKQTPYQYRYNLNYCTFNYSMSWWNWERWQWEIDWMALNGINMPLAITGQNSIWNRVYKSLGFTEQDLSTFFSGPAYFNWFWMGNLDGWGGPLPQSFMQYQENLQKKILQRERELGMTPILPAFTGHVPPSFKDKFPTAKLKKTNWQGFNDVYILDPDDPIFTQLGKKFIEEEIKTFGTNHLYSADTFNENTPPTNDSLYLNNVSKKVYESMSAVDNKAVWIMQGWMFSYSAAFWQPTQIKALLNAVPNDKMIVLDLYSESKPVWNKTDAYYGKPWIWCMLHNFGGNVSMYGRMDEVANNPSAALHDKNSGKLSGIGLTPEAIEQNPVMYALMLENVWQDHAVNLDTWLPNYISRRYGAKNEDANAAWNILRRTVYKGDIRSGGAESIITGRPTFAKTNKWTNTKKYYNPAELIKALELFNKAAVKLKESDGFKYDFIDLTRQVMANYADTLQIQFAIAYKNKNSNEFKQLSTRFINVIEDLDLLLASRKDFLLGKWINDARKLGNTLTEKDIYEQNARNQITLWGDKNSPLHDYACKQWSGMLNDFYKPRWQQFINDVNESFETNKAFNQKVFDEKISTWEWEWVKQRKSFTDKAVNNEIEIATKLYKKYLPLLKSIYKE